jgi:hypothetical protein
MTKLESNVEMKSMPIGDGINNNNNFINSNKDDNFDDEDEELDNDIEDEEEVLGEYIIEDMKKAAWDSRYVAPIVGFVGFLIAIYISVYSNYHHHQKSYVKPISHEALSLLRPVISEDDQISIQKVMMHAENYFKMPDNDLVTLVFHSAATKHGTHQPPGLFYEGVTFGITADNSHDLLYTSTSDGSHSNLFDDLSQMYPKPTNILERNAKYNVTDWSESGYAVYFSYEDLKKQGKFSSDKLEPHKRVLEDIMVIARDYKQISCTVWYPHEFGKMDNASDPHKYKTLVQQIIPTRTGLGSIKSTSAVWMSKVNHNKVVKHSDVIRKAWTAYDHWSSHVPDEQKKLFEQEKVRKLVEQGVMADIDSHPRIEEGDWDYEVYYGDE